MKKKKNQKQILYLHVESATKTWLKGVCRKQVGRVSQSTMVERILVAAKKNPQLIGVA